MVRPGPQRTSLSTFSHPHFILTSTCGHEEEVLVKLPPLAISAEKRLKGKGREQVKAKNEER
jgi:hypothetical protein